MSNQTYGARSFIVFGNLGILPIYPNTCLDARQEPNFTPILSNVSPVNYFPGLITPIVTVRFPVRDVNDGVLRRNGSTGILDYLIQRITNITNDVYTIGDIYVWNGRECTQVKSAKLDAFSISSQKGGDIDIVARFVGLSADVVGYVAPASFPGWDTSRLLRFNALTFGGTLASFPPVSFALTYCNNHFPEWGMNGTYYPVKWCAGSPTCNFQIVEKAIDYDPITKGDYAQVIVNGTGRQCLFTAAQCIPSNSRSVSLTAPQNYKTYTYTVKASDPSLTPMGVVNVGAW